MSSKEGYLKHGLRECKNFVEQDLLAGESCAFGVASGGYEDKLIFGDDDVFDANEYFTVVVWIGAWS